MQILSPAQRRPITVETAAVRQGGRALLDAWRALGWIGIAFALLGLIDVALGWYPPAFGNAEWEFGTISGTLNALAIPMLGLYLVLASSIARSDRRSARIVAVVMGLLLATILLLGVIYLTVLPIAIKAVSSNALVALGMKKAVVKAVTLGVADAVLLGAGMVKGWRVAPAT
jgi:magnesium-transporting ATPase (P-type)